MSKPNPLEHLNACERSAFELFALVSRLDFALIRSGFRQVGRPIFANWDCFAENVAPLLRNSPDDQVHNAIKYLNENPPKKLSVSGDQLSWVASKCNFKSPEACAVKAASQVRNNLFHGAKGDHRERNDCLINAALSVLYECLIVHPAVRSAFDAPM